jgi:hypothetical protein
MMFDKLERFVTAHRPERSARPPQDRHDVLHRAHQPGLDRAEEREVVEPLRLRTSRLGTNLRHFQLRQDRSAFVEALTSTSRSLMCFLARSILTRMRGTQSKGAVRAIYDDVRFSTRK